MRFVLWFHLVSVSLEFQDSQIPDSSVFYLLVWRRRLVSGCVHESSVCLSFPHQEKSVNNEAALTPHWSVFNLYLNSWYWGKRSNKAGLSTVTSSEVMTEVSWCWPLKMLTQSSVVLFVWTPPVGHLVLWLWLRAATQETSRFTSSSDSCEK